MTRSEDVLALTPTVSGTSLRLTSLLSGEAGQSSSLHFQD